MRTFICLTYYLWPWIVISGLLNDKEYICMIPYEYKNFYFGKNSLFFPECEFVIKLSFPRVFVKYIRTEGYYSDFDKFFDNIADVQYLEGKRPSEMEHNKIITEIWNFITMEKNPKRDDYISGNHNS